jgi:hypothetical protein
MYQGNQPAFRFQIIPSVAQDLMAVYDKFSHEADRISGLNSILLGQVEQASNSRTASGLSMLIANAAKVIKNTIGNIDREIVAPLITGYYNWILVNDDQFHGKVDAQVNAQGAAGALQRELMQSRTMELLTMLTQYVQLGVVPPGTIILLLREILSAAGYNADTMLPSVDATMMQIQNVLAGQGQPTPGSQPQVQGSAPKALGPPQPGNGDGRFIPSPV